MTQRTAYESKRNSRNDQASGRRYGYPQTGPEQHDPGSNYRNENQGARQQFSSNDSYGRNVDAQRNYDQNYAHQNTHDESSYRGDDDRYYGGQRQDARQEYGNQYTRQGYGRADQDRQESYRQDFNPSYGRGSTYDDRYDPDRYESNESWNRERYSASTFDQPNNYGRSPRRDAGYSQPGRFSQSGGYSQGGYAEQSGDLGQYQNANFSSPSYAGNQASSSYRGKGPKGYTRTDDRLKEDISERLTHDHRIDASEIEVRCQNGLVTIEGKISDRQTKYRVEELVEQCYGVKDIDNRLKVDQSYQNDQDQDRPGKTNGTTANTNASASNQSSQNQPKAKSA